ncbi:MAG: hypothetical protein H6652_22355 [Ardenticatenaceae bacterium]|nr:hypothetical protein [Ardenticatenaceae bacterium]MCB8947750.1 hypothetical protein [Ardenticatenaceae bacterium]
MTPKTANKFRSRLEQDGKRPFLILLLFFCLVVLLLFVWQPIAPVTAAPTDVADLRVAETVPSSQPAYGVNFISWAKGLTPVSQTRYDNGKATGATWNRWPLYWYDIEQSDGNFSWAYQDVAVENDLAQGFRLDAILLGTPSFYTTSAEPVRPLPRPVPGRPLSIDAVQAATPIGLYEPVFNDNSDILGVGKQINQANRWARFVYTAVSRYKPGGVLAQAHGWPAGQGVTHWEMWNEPDLSSFWDGTTADYARLLKVGYLAAKLADPNAQILFGGLANNSNNANFYSDVMGIYDTDSQATSYAYYHDIFATHNYLYAWRSWYQVWRASNTLAARNLEKPIWLNESGVPVWDDYPGPVCEPTSPFRASMSEQADFIIQSAFYATYAGADNIFFFQLYDDCGNQPGGTNFTPVTSCTGDPTIDPGGDAFGLFSNVSDPSVSGCYWEHPNGGTPRPGFTAFQLLTTHFTDVEPLWRLRPGSNDPVNGPQEWIAFYQPATKSRILGLWARFGEAQTAVIPTTNANGTAQLLWPDGTMETITAVNGQFTVNLPAATNQNAIWDPALYPIGGRPAILIEQDTLPPTVSLSGPVVAKTEIDLSWSGSDDGSGMATYDLLVAVDGGAFVPWLVGESGETAVYPSELGRIYQFMVVGHDQAGNQANSNLISVITIELTEAVYLPTIMR